MAKNNFVLSSERIYKDNVSSNVVNARDIMEQMFSKKINLLLESKRPRKSYSTKGKLCSRRLYQTPFNDNVFTKHNHIPTSDTTIVMLIDASGSMDGSVNINLGTEGYKMRQLEACNAVVSAFAKSVDRVTNNAIKLEVFTKTSADIADSNILGMRGAFPALTRVFTNSTKRMDVDRILQLDTMSPIIRKREDGERDGIGSSTPEYAVLPALFNWIKKNVTTKNIVNDTIGNLEGKYWWDASESLYDIDLDLDNNLHIWVLQKDKKVIQYYNNIEPFTLPETEIELSNCPLTYKLNKPSFSL